MLTLLSRRVPSLLVLVCAWVPRPPALRQVVATAARISGREVKEWVQRFRELSAVQRADLIDHISDGSAIPSGQVTNDLISLLSDPLDDVRRFACEIALASGIEPQLRSPLRERLKDDSDLVRLSAVHALLDADLAVQDAADALRTLVGRSLQVDTRLRAVELLCRARNINRDTRVELLVVAAADLDPSVRCLAARCIGDSPAGGESTLYELLFDVDESVRRTAVDVVLRRTDTRSVVQQLAADAVGRRSGVRRQAILSVSDLADRDDKELRSFYVRFLDDPEPNVRVAALRAVGRLGPSARCVRDRLEAMMRKGGEDLSVRREVVRTIGRIGPQDEPTMHLLLAALADDDAATKRAAFEGLLYFNPAVFADEPEVVAQLRVDDRSTRESVAALVCSIAAWDERHSAELRQLLDDPVASVRTWAAFGVRLAPSNCAGLVPRLRQMLCEDPCEATRFEVARALGALGGLAGPSAPELVLATKDSSARVRIEATDALGHVGVKTGAVLRRLQSLQEGGDNGLSRVARNSLVHLGEPISDAGSATSAVSIRSMPAVESTIVYAASSIVLSNDCCAAIVDVDDLEADGSTTYKYRFLARGQSSDSRGCGVLATTKTDGSEPPYDLCIGSLTVEWRPRARGAGVLRWYPTRTVVALVDRVQSDRVDLGSFLRESP